MDRWALVPIFNSDLGFYDRQRFMFNDWLPRFDEDFRALDMHNSMLRFDRELDRIRDSLFTLGDASGSGRESNTIDSPFVTDAQGNRKLALRYDVSQFAPEEVTVKSSHRPIVRPITLLRPIKSFVRVASLENRKWKIIHNYRFFGNFCIFFQEIRKIKIQYFIFI